jgi:LysM repeat protein
LNTRGVTLLVVLCVLAGSTGACFGGGGDDGGSQGPDASKIPTATLPAPLPEVRVLGESAVSTGGRRTYTIRSGDTLSAVADRYAVTLDDLLAANPGIDPTGLVAGDVINLPESASANAATPQPEPTEAPAEEVLPTDTPAPVPTEPPVTPTTQSLGSTYTVQAGDSFASIAAQFGVTIEALAAANQGVDPNALQPGQVLIIPPPAPAGG